MTTDTMLTELVHENAESFQVDGAPLETIMQTANRRTRRNRVLGGLGAIALAGAMFVGIGSVGQTERPTEMFAGLAQVEDFNAPSAMIATDDGWLGAIVIADPDSRGASFFGHREASGEVHIATSSDGETWELQAPTGLRTSSWRPLPIAEHDGRHWIAVTEQDRVQLAFSDNLETWTLADLPAEAAALDLAVEADGLIQVIEVDGLVATDAGVLFKVIHGHVPEILDSLDFDPDVTCDLRVHSRSTQSRECGSSTWVTTDTGDSVFDNSFLPRGETHLLFSPDGTNFELLDEGQIRQRYSSNYLLYEVDGGFGFSDYKLVESRDGREWSELEVAVGPGRLSSPSFVAARGSERVALSETFGPNGAHAFVSQDGETWAMSSLTEALGLEDQARFRTRGLVSGPAGWALTGVLSLNTADTFPPVRLDGIDEFEVSLGAYALTGLLPGGPAELVDERGDVVRSWDGFEPARPWKTGVETLGTELVFVESDDPAERVAISIADWNAGLNGEEPLSYHVLLFSPDGVDWTVLRESFDGVRGVAVGDDEVVISTFEAEGPVSQRIEVPVSEG